MPEPDAARGPDRPRRTRARAAPVYLVTGDRVLAEPAAERLAAAAAEKRRLCSRAPPPPFLPRPAAGRPAHLRPVRRRQGRAGGRDRRPRRQDRRRHLPRPGGGGSAPLGGDGLSAAERRAALRLLQAIRLFDLDPYRGDPAARPGPAPGLGVQGGERPALEEEGRGDPGRPGGDARPPPGPPSSRASPRRRSPSSRRWSARACRRATCWCWPRAPWRRTTRSLEALAGHKAVLGAGPGRVREGDWSGLDELTAELARQTGVTIDRPALAALARRTLRGGSGWGTSPPPRPTPPPASPASTGSSRTSPPAWAATGSLPSWWRRRSRTGARRTCSRSSTRWGRAGAPRPWTG